MSWPGGINFGLNGRGSLRKLRQQAPPRRCGGATERESDSLPQLRGVDHCHAAQRGFDGDGGRAAPGARSTIATGRARSPRGQESLERPEEHASGAGSRASQERVSPERPGDAQSARRAGASTGNRTYRSSGAGPPITVGTRVSRERRIRRSPGSGRPRPDGQRSRASSRFARAGGQGPTADTRSARAGGTGTKPKHTGHS